MRTPVASTGASQKAAMPPIQVFDSMIYPYISKEHILVIPGYPVVSRQSLPW